MRFRLAIWMCVCVLMPAVLAANKTCVAPIVWSIVGSPQQTTAALCVAAWWVITAVFLFTSFQKPISPRPTAPANYGSHMAIAGLFTLVTLCLALGLPGLFDKWQDWKSVSCSVALCVAMLAYALSGMLCYKRDTQETRPPNDWATCWHRVCLLITE